MNQNKGKKIIVTAIIITVILIVAISAYIVLATDMLKSDKDIFMKYLGEITDTENGLIEKNLKEYYAKKATTSYRHETDFYVTGETNSDVDFKSMNDMNVHISGQVDNNAKKRFSDISIDYSDNVSFPLKVILGQDMQGIQTEYIGGKYIVTTGTETEKIKPEGLSEIENQLSNLFQDIQTANIQFHTIFQEEIPNATFTKVTNNEETGYQVSLTGVNVKSIIEKAKQAIKSDDILDNLAKKIEDTDNIQMIVYPRNNQRASIELKKENERIKITKDITGNDLTYTIEYQSKETSKLTCTLKYTGLQSAQNVNEMYEVSFQSTVESTNSNSITISEEKERVGLLRNAAYATKMRETNGAVDAVLTKEDIEKEITDEEVEIEQLSNNRIKITFTKTNNEYVLDETSEIVEEPEKSNTKQTTTSNITYKVENQVSFPNNINIETLNSENALILEDMEEEARENFLNAVEERIASVNKTQMEELGLRATENPLFIVLMPVQALTYNMAIDAIQQTSMLSEVELNTHNEKFLKFEGENIQGSNVNALFNLVGSNNVNKENKDKLITQILLNGEKHEIDEEDIINKVNELQRKIKIGKYYKVAFEKEEDTGLINKIIINEK